MIKKWLILCFCFAICATKLHAQQPPTREELVKQQQQLLSELSDLNKDLASIHKNKKTALSAYTVVRRKIAAREALINSINKDIHLLTETIYQNQISIYRLRKELDTLKLQYAQSLVFAYKNRGSYDYLNFLFSAQTFNDALKRMTYLKNYRQYRETQAVTIAKTQELLQSAIGKLNNNRSEKSEVLTTQSSQLQVLEEDKKEKDQVVKQLKAQEKDIAAQIKQRQRDKIRLRNAIDAAIKRAIAEAEKAQKEARKAQLAEKKRQAKKTKDDTNSTVKSGGSKTTDAIENNTPSEPTSPTKAESSTANTNTPTETKKVVNREYSSFESTPENVKESIDFEKSRGRLPWPLDGGRIYGQFGRHKIEGTKLEADNDGIFIKTEVGATVKCVANGEVLKVFELDPYQAVMVKHGKYFTTYNMLSAVSVKEGDEVKAGTVLGKVAADLDGDGQFEFQVMNEKRVFQNPERWLRSK